jgi:ABC-2 type transport system permease protein
MRGLLQLTWIELKIFLREPLGALGTLAVPVLAFVALGRATAGRADRPTSWSIGLLGPGGVATLVSILITTSAVLSLVTIVSIYREGGILKRLRATPLRPGTILTAHVLVKLFMTVLTMAAMILAGRRYFTIGPEVPVLSFGIALLFATLSILSIGFVIASVVPTARFAQPVGALVLYPMIALSGLFVPVDVLPPWLRTVTRALPMPYAVSLLQGIWRGEGWGAHLGDVAALALVLAVCLAISSRVFRWE